MDFQSYSNYYQKKLKLLDEIVKKHSLIKLCIENTTDFVNTHFMDLRNDVQLVTEICIEQINDLSSEIIEEIDEYEQEMMEYNKKNSQSLDKFNVIVKELELFHTVNTENLNEYEVDEKLLIKSNKAANNLIRKAELEIANLKSIIFDRRFFKFEKNCFKIEKSILGITKIDYNSDSGILTSKEQFIDLISLCGFPIDEKWYFLYRARHDGFETARFHSNCDYKPNTLIIIKSENGNIFGGYTEQSWSGECFKNDQNAFIFSLVNKLNEPLKMKCINPKRAIFCHKNLGPNFGGYDFEININSNSNSHSISYLGQSYKHPNYASDSNEGKSFLAGCHKFQVSDIEVYTKLCSQQ
jgi:hypothetical protein